jgi:hypothetical protein
MHQSLQFDPSPIDISGMRSADTVFVFHYPSLELSVLRNKVDTHALPGGDLSLN